MEGQENKWFGSTTKTDNMQNVWVGQQEKVHTTRWGDKFTDANWGGRGAKRRGNKKKKFGVGSSNTGLPLLTERMRPMAKERKKTVHLLFFPS